VCGGCQGKSGLGLDGMELAGGYFSVRIRVAIVAIPNSTEISNPLKYLMMVNTR